MSLATGLGPLDTALLLEVDDTCGDLGRGVKSKRILQRLYATTGEDPLDGYSAMTSLVQEWLTPLPLLEGRGNFGWHGDSPADMQYTECRLSDAGRAAVAAERGYGPPIPLGLINGSTFRGGARPPFDPLRVADAVVAVARGGSPDDAALVLGLPAFPGGAALSVGLHDADMDHLRRGWSASLTLEPVIREIASGGAGRPPALVISALPPYSGWDAVLAGIADHARKAGSTSPIRYVNDYTDFEHGLRIECHPAEDTSLESLRAFLCQVPGVVTTLAVRLAAPAADLLAGWVDQHGAEAAIAGAEALRTLIDEDPS